VRRIAVCWLAALMMSSCGSTARDAATTTSRPASTTTATPSRPGTVSFSFAGDAGVSGVATDASATCSFPDIDGLRISVFAHAADPRVSYRMSVAADTVFISVDTGEGRAFRERNFEGTGVSSFDAATGAHVDAHLTEAPPTAGIDPGTLGRITAVKGSIDCGDQTPGSAHLEVTGATSAGRYEHARLDPVVVECYFASGQLSVIGIARAGDQRVLFLISLGPNGMINAEEAPRHAPPRYYASVGGAALTANGGTAAGEAVEKNATPPHALRIEGDVTCGTPRRS